MMIKTSRFGMWPSLLAVAALSLTACEKEITENPISSNIDNENTSAQGRYIVIMKGQSEGTPSSELIDRLLKKHRLAAGSKIKSFSGFNKGFYGKITAEEIERLKKDSDVAFIEPDHEIRLEQTTTTTTTASTQIIPWGVNRVGKATGVGKTAWIIDSGIQFNHPDLTVDVTRSRSFISTSTSPQDFNGHGTMCAGIIAAKNNTIGVLGVASGAKVVSLRTMDANGSGLSSSVVAALNYAYMHAQPGDVVNMSLGGPASTAVDNAVIALANKGVYVAVAAGNSSVNCLNTSPARVNHPKVYTVSAMSQGDTWASFSNFGLPVDYCAPGVNITTTTKGSTYASGNGTSFAAPHMAGLLLLKGSAIVNGGYVKNDPDGVADKIAHR
jgi:subtilisin family serine protease